MFCCTQSEITQTERYEKAYALSSSPVMRRIERLVCGCDYGGNSWTTKSQARDLVGHLDLRPGVRLLDLGAGAGWPGLYLAGLSGCDAVLADLPEVGLRLAEERAASDGLRARVSVEVADAADLPHPSGSFDAINHSDLLCCLVRKRDVLRECRRVIRPDGRMCFSVISIVPGLSSDDETRARRFAPEFAPLETDYRTLLSQTAWDILDVRDLTGEYYDSCDRQIAADRAHRSDLRAMLGAEAARDRRERWRGKLAGIRDGLYLRELFVCRPGTNEGNRQP